MKQSEFMKWLKKQGATFEDGTRHIKVFLNGERSVIPRHPAKEILKGTIESIKKQLKLK